MIEQKISKNILLAPFTTFKIGGQAKYFLKVKKVQDIIKAIQWANKEKVDFFILGGGSNVLFSDKEFNGLIIKIESIKNGMVVLPKQSGHLRVIAWAGNNLSQLINFVSSRGGKGLEHMAGIPGTIGGAVRGNAGAFGVSMSDFVEQVSVLRDGKIIDLRNKNIKFFYRDSIFKHNQDVILNIVLRFGKTSSIESKKIIQANIKQRRKFQPKEPSVGCIFKNIKLNDIPFQIKKSDLISDNFKKLGMIPAGLLIDKCGLKGEIINDAQISTQHANFIINKKNAKSEDVVALIKKIKKCVKDKFNINLREEIKYV
ncbi:UDP-N-acetylmuramate dehydrogenase [Patescibacteria group bacterium]|nr:UDP-N-acetylmuramate dehydrogenase [Patescibacteria group bacterium]